MLKRKMKINITHSSNLNSCLLNEIYDAYNDLNSFFKEIDQIYWYRYVSMGQFYSLQIRTKNIIKMVFGNDSEEYKKVEECYNVEMEQDGKPQKTSLQNITGILLGYLYSAYSTVKVKNANKKYQFFVSSTYKDLIGIRKIFADVIIRTGNFYVGMEDFRTSQVPQQEYLSQNIYDSDFYLLIIGSNYGSIMENQDISFTQFEYEIAKKLNKPVYVFICSNQNMLTECETEDEIKKRKLNNFITCIKRECNPCYFVDEGDLRNKLQECIYQNIRLYPNGGWIKSY